MDITNNGKMYHINCTAEDIGKYVIVPGDPGRCERIAAYFDDAKHVSFNREYNIYTGYLNGEKVSVCSTGIGGPSAAIAIEELVMLGAHTFVRVGTCGGIAIDVNSGDNCIAMSAIRMSGTADEYAPEDYPATASYDVVTALVEASEKINARYHVGVVQCKDSFYGQHSPETMPVSGMLQAKWEAYKKLGVLASEMESDTIFTVAAARGVRAGSVFHVVWNQERAKLGLPMEKTESNEPSIKIAVEALRILIERDKKK